MLNGTVLKTDPSPIPSTWSLPAAIADRVGATVGRQRAMVAEGHLLLLLHAVPGTADPDRRGVLVWRDPQGTWRGSERGNGPGLVRAVLEAYDDAIDAVEARAKEAKTAEEWFDVIQRIGPLHRASRHLHATLQAARSALPDLHPLIDLRDRAIEVERAAELLAEACEQSLRYALARQAERQSAAAREMARSAYRLNALMAVCLPLTAVSGVFGMNLKMGINPGPWAFWSTAGVALALGAYVWRKFSRPVDAR